jgi:hypothetical protein
MAQSTPKERYRKAAGSDIQLTPNKMALAQGFLRRPVNQDRLP